MKVSKVNGRGHGFVCLVLSLTLALAAGDAWAQSAGSIAGVARDTTGAVLPGVTVEASSPALIEGVRVAVTDGQGNYKVIDLRPGTYAVTFTLPGFSRFRREGIALNTGFTATVNAELAVGALEETVTVTGASPLVDIQNTRTQTVLTQDVLDALPINKTTTGFAVVTLGAVGRVSGGYDVGGNKGENSSMMAMHGVSGWEMKKAIDGMNYNSSRHLGGGMVSIHDVNQSAMAEAVIETGANAESETGGVQLNYVPKDGGNQFSAYAAGNYTDENLVTASLSDDLRSQGLRSAASVRKIYDMSFGVGGPIKRDRVWFYASARRTDAQEYQPGTYWNKMINTPFYEPDLDSGLVWTYFPTNDISWRITAQGGEKHRFTVSDSLQRGCLCRRANSRTSPEASTHQWTPWWESQLIQSTWTYTANNQLLLQAGASFGLFPQDKIAMAPRDGQPGLDPATAINIFDSALGVTYGAVNRGGPLNSYDDLAQNFNFNQRFSVSYVTGSHSFKAGMQHTRKHDNSEPFLYNDISYLFINQVPNRLTLWASPQQYDVRLTNVAFYAQDQWTIDRLTLNLGVRYDHFSGKNLAGSLPERQYVPAFEWEAVSGVPFFNDLNARVGLAYDLSGDGRTAIKASLGRYGSSIGLNPYTFAAHPATQAVDRTNRNWNDANGNYVPDCDLRDPVANGECGAMSNRAFGGTAASTNFFLDDAKSGWGNRGYNWQSNISLQHELVPGLALNVTYFRNWLGNFLAEDNTFVTPGDFDEYCVTVPTDSRLPRSGGQLCGLYDVNPALFGLERTEITQLSNFGERSEVFSGVDLSVNARFEQGSFLQGGVSFGQTSTDSCGAVVDVPAPETAYCNVVPPWGAGSQVKLSGAFPLPWWGLQPSFAYQNLAGAAIGGALRYSNAQILPSLGRNLASGARGTVNVNVVEPQTLFLERVNQLDLRVTKVFEAGAARVRVMLDIYNALNARTILSVSQSFGAAWQRPVQAMPGRIFKFGATYQF